MSTLNDKLIKKAYSTCRYTQLQIDEITACMHPVTGPMYFLKNFMWIQHPMKGREQFVPYPFQIELINTYHNYRKSISMLSRQLGKCVDADTEIQIRNKTTGEIKKITMAEFHALSSGSNNQSADQKNM